MLLKMEGRQNIKQKSGRQANYIRDRTTGGNGGTVTTVSTLAQFTATANNAKNDDTTLRIIVVSGTISGAQQVRIGSNKSIIGLPGASTSLMPFQDYSF